MTLNLKNITKKSGLETHIDLNATLEPGTIHVLLGATLAGKTTLLRLIAGLDQPTSGTIEFNGQDLTGVRVQDRNIAMVYQQFINYPSFTAHENIASPLRLKKAPNIDARVREIATSLRIEHLLERRPAELSGGQQQRLAIARALAKDAKLLLLDEPLANLDYKLREEIRDELRDIFRKRSTTILYASAEPREALQLGGHALLMHEGRLIQHGPALDVYNNPGNLTAARIFSDPPLNVFAGRIRDEGGQKQIQLPEGATFPAVHALKELPPGDYNFAIRAGDTHLKQQTPDDFALTGSVELAEISGSETLVHVRTPGAPFIVQEDGTHAHDLNATVTFYINPQKIYAFPR